ncbi:hypothetical protein ACCO45_001247 [Purpureocillium lilacinum]|uniref:Uncharacterized protein n=1 Tax=Purpureocillium lilacinum TaxID=33203 RepID=A0ACC4E7D2_PURLI
MHADKHGRRRRKRKEIKEDWGGAPAPTMKVCMFPPANQGLPSRSGVRLRVVPTSVSECPRPTLFGGRQADRSRQGAELRADWMLWLDASDGGLPSFDDDAGVIRGDALPGDDNNLRTLAAALEPPAPSAQLADDAPSPLSEAP